jgi:Asp-tRNA(Asn)/Glu-tRNA(Gln) amidotransferase A subunit family amidase
MPLDDPEAADLRGLHVAFYTDDEVTPTTPETAAAVRDASEALRAAGAQLNELCPESRTDAQSVNRLPFELARLGRELVAKLVSTELPTRPVK